MSRLIVGHVSHNNARIWVRGTKKHPVAHLKLEDENGSIRAPKDIHLEERHFFTGVFDVKKLDADTPYVCNVAFSSVDNKHEIDNPKYGTGTFRTYPDPDEASGSFSFLLLSCNLHSLGIIASPDAAYKKLSNLARKNKARFAIHAGDQIYYDVPKYNRDPDLEEYRKTYLDAWEDCEPTAKFLTELPHYMILDDHEIIDNYANDYDIRSGAPTYLQESLATKAYREFQHLHNPQSYSSGPLYYKFDSGNARFFVLDTRTERYKNAPEAQMISGEQMQRFRRWLGKNRQSQLFVVSSVPFVSNVRKSDDKWSSPGYRRQREEVLKYIWKNDIKRLCFLTGDMHNSHHATLTLKGSGHDDIVIHELMSSPVNQLQKNRISAYVIGQEQPVDNKIGFTYSSQIANKEFYTGHSNAMVVKVSGTRVSYEIHRTKKSDMKPEKKYFFRL